MGMVSSIASTVPRFFFIDPSSRQSTFLVMTYYGGNGINFSYLTEQGTSSLDELTFHVGESLCWEKSRKIYWDWKVLVTKCSLSRLFSGLGLMVEYILFLV